MADEPYDMVPHKEISDLKKQIKDLKSKASGSESKDMVGSINKLTTEMNSLMGLFKSAADEMKLEEKDEHFVAKKMEPLIDKLDEIIEQNKTIAEGIVVVADTLKENMEKPHEMHLPKHKQEFGPDFEPPKPEIPNFSDIPPRKEPIAPKMPRHTPPRPMPAMPMPSMPEPFQFEETKKKKGLFGRFK
jgi:hypothetical protein